jgi:parvulin-like peptidyl-prolyl isomerase
MITRRGAALAVGIVALVATGCSSARIAATVDGAEIDEATVLSIRADNDGAVSVSGEQYRSDLSRLIFTEVLLIAANEDFGLNDLDTSEAQDAYLVSIDPREKVFLDSVADNPLFTAETVNVSLVQLMLRSKVREALAHDPEFLADLWDSEGNDFTRVCPRHILVASEAEAFVVLDRLDTGESFADVANEVSLDDSSVDGVLPCPSPPSVYVAPFATALVNAPVGELTEPVQTEFGWHIIVVESRESVDTFEELSADPLKWVAAETLESMWTSWIDDAVTRAEVTVRSDIGTWSSPSDGIVPPPRSP